MTTTQTKTVAEHTPGPWTAQGVGEKFEITAPAKLTDRYPGNFVASFYNAGGYNNTPRETIAANARLGAAAPDMLEALKSICGVFEGQEDVPIYVRKARAALARATGREG